MKKLRQFAVVLSSAVLALPATTSAQIGRGGDQPAPNAIANAYRTDVRNRLNQLVIQLAGAWDATDPREASNLYAERGTIVLGPEMTIEGRNKIKAAFAATLRHMRGVVLTIDDYDMSGELAFVRGTMIYEILHEGGAGTQETVTYTMVLRRQRNDDWLIQSQMLAGTPVLPAKATGNTTTSSNSN
jgi:uncharacterized protein (TIGR02246 family)